MANINPVGVEYFESYTDEIQSKFYRVKQLVSHPVASGDYHEEIIRNVLRNFLTKRFSVKKGFIFKDHERVSKQVDIMIIDEYSPAAYLFQEGDFAIVIPEAVIAVMEVKTSLNLPDFERAVDNIASVESLYETPQITSPMSIILGYEGTTPSDENLSNWFTSPTANKYKDKNNLLPNAIMFFTEGCLLARYDVNGKWDYGCKYYHKVFRDTAAKTNPNDIGWQLSIILAIIISSCERAEFNKTHFFTDSKANRLVQASGGYISKERFVFGEGKSIFESIN